MSSSEVDLVNSKLYSSLFNQVNQVQEKVFNESDLGDEGASNMLQHFFSRSLDIFIQKHEDLNFIDEAKVVCSLMDEGTDFKTKYSKECQSCNEGDAVREFIDKIEKYHFSNKTDNLVSVLWLSCYVFGWYQHSGKSMSKEQICEELYNILLYENDPINNSDDFNTIMWPQLCLYSNFKNWISNKYGSEINSQLIKENQPKEKTGGCYIATSVYGSYDCPEVWTLRRFRDYKLDKSLFGRLFIRFYYCVSPIIVKYFGNNKTFKCFCLSKLNKFVKSLKEKGYEDTPYIDILQ